MIYLTPQRDYAEQYGEVGEYYVNPGRVFDMINNPEHRQKAIDMFNERGGWTVAYEEHGCFSEEDMEARGHDLNFNPEFDEHWEIIDNPETDIISDLKQEYDTIIMEEWSEHGHTSYALSDPSRIRSIHDSFLPEPESVNPGASSVERFEARLRQVSGADLDASDSVDASPKGPRL